MTVARVPSVPPLQPGDHLDSREFERRYDATPNLKKAELLDGVVYMPPPVSQEGHSGPHFALITWCGTYCAATQGTAGGDDGTLRLDIHNEPQPDAFLYILPTYGGQAPIDEDGYVKGAPEFVAEVAATSASYDLHVKKTVYRRHRVKEYLVWRVFDQAVNWFALRGGNYEELAAGPDGILRSEVFPGLWLDPRALLSGDLAGVLQGVRQGLSSPEHAQFAAQLREKSPG